MALSSTLRIKLAASQTGSNDFGGPTFSPVLEHVINLANGVAADQADLLFVDQRSVATSTNDDIDLAGVLASAFGITIAAAKMKALILINAPQSGPANTSSLTVGGGSAPFLGFLGGTTPTIGPIGPGGFLVLGCPTLLGLGIITPTTADILRIGNGSGGTAIYQLGLVLTSS
jgi:hypothetical protein